MTTSPGQLPDWVANRLPAGTIESAATIAAELDRITWELGPLLFVLKDLIEVRDRIIAERLAEYSEVDIAIFSETHIAFEAITDAPFGAVDRLGWLLDRVHFDGGLTSGLLEPS